MWLIGLRPVQPGGARVSARVELDIFAPHLVRSLISRWGGAVAPVVVALACAGSASASAPALKRIWTLKTGGPGAARPGGGGGGRVSRARGGRRDGGQPGP